MSVTVVSATVHTSGVFEMKITGSLVGTGGDVSVTDDAARVSG
jgi:hypothetical protein